MRVNGQLGTIGTLGVAVALFFSPVAAASPFRPRVPQVPVLGDALQTYFIDLGQWIDVLNDQVDGQVWTASISPVSKFGLQVAAGVAGNAIGVYNTGGPLAPPLFEVFSNTAPKSLLAIAVFTQGNLIVTLVDSASVVVGQRTYSGVDASNFGFYIQGPRGTFYSQDARNGGMAQALTYLGTWQDQGAFWECFEDSASPASDRDFDDEVLYVQPLTGEGPPTPVERSTWGRIKNLYRR